ncbi:UDP-glucose 4-epimerase GalE [Curtobacterium sp. Leaf261]|uniref:UDP-glucose 4-epimerase GalE n=1 Tax=Curtobacterium sp. Leaf261 TaxID=1736311 RepID=UPI0006F32184|nr:UDP-glucose 4-epimerase GalE [Curtobacterium sp. Leaf261]KQO61372.1 UDP-glucose 4-epimerase [Curtobacterium sp. Leaf261]
MSLLITGGAGYIGSHVVDLLEQRGERVVVLDDLSSGVADRLRAPLNRCDLAAPHAGFEVAAMMRAHHVTGVVHLAALKDVGESMADPESYWRVNVHGLGTLLSAMRTVGVRDLVFSSSAAVYGDADGAAVSEDGPCAPMNPYGESKLVGEWMLAAAARAWGLRYAALRYFNVAGSGSPELADRGRKNLIPIIIDEIRNGRSPQVFGTGHGTRDGSCVRDYVHVLDLANAHLDALDAICSGRFTGGAVNIGSGTGATVLEVVRAVGAELGTTVSPIVVEARAGDPAALVADVSRAADVLGWHPLLGLDRIVESAVAGTLATATA